MRDAETILVVDDEANIRTILTYLLEQNGFRVVQASDGKAALAYLQSEAPDLVILDVMMPEIDGLEVLASMRSHYRTLNIPVILLTARGETPHRVQGLQEGANDYMVKPFEHRELILRVCNMLTFSRVQRDANPLTGLPGNRAIEQELTTRLEAAKPFGFLYIDLDNFKAYNDYYGYSRGDKVLLLLAECLQHIADSHAGETFLGHVGGDDFVAVMDVAEAAVFAQRIVEEFEQRKRYLYDPEDWSRGYIEVQDRGGSLTSFDHVTMTVAVVEDRHGDFGHIGRVNAVAAELKQFGKQQTGNAVVHERRDSFASDDALVVSPQGSNQDPE